MNPQVAHIRLLANWSVQQYMDNVSSGTCRCVCVALGAARFARYVRFLTGRVRDGSVCDAVASFLPHMRFVEMGHAFIQHRVRQSGLVPPETVLDAVMKIMDEKIPQLEPGCKRAFLSENETDAGGGPAKKRRRG